MMAPNLGSMPPDPTMTSWINDLVASAPSLNGILDEHRQFNGELLPHVFFADITPWIEREFRTASDSEELWAFLRSVDTGFASGDAAIVDVVSTSFLECLDHDANLIHLLPTHLADEAKRRFPGVFATYALPLTNDERWMLTRGLREWGGPADGDDIVARFMEFEDYDDLVRHTGAFIAAQVEAGEPLTALDWDRTLLATESVFIGYRYGAAGDWETTAGIELHHTVDMLESVHAKIYANRELSVAMRQRHQPHRRQHRVLIRLTTPMSKLASDWWTVDRIIFKDGRARASSTASDRRRVYIGNLRDANERVEVALEDPTLRVDLVVALVNGAPTDVHLESHTRLKLTIWRELAHITQKVDREGLLDRIGDSSNRGTLCRWMENR